MNKTDPHKVAGSAQPISRSTSFPRLAWYTLVGWFEHSAPSRGASIAYYTLFALAPMLLIVIAFAGLVFGQDAVRGEIVGQISGLIGRDGAEAVQAILQRAQQPREGISATVLGLIGLLIAATGAFLELQAALNRIWGVETEPNAGFDVRGLLTRRLRSLGALVSISFLLLVSLTISAGVNAAVQWFGQYAEGWPIAVLVLDQLVSLAVSTLLFGMLFLVLPDVHLSWRDVSVGAAVTAVLFAVGQRLIGLYLARSAMSSPFGAAGAVAIILVWVYYSTQIVLLGAEFTRVWAARNGRVVTTAPGAHTDDSSAR